VRVRALSCRECTFGDFGLRSFRALARVTCRVISWAYGEQRLEGGRRCRREWQGMNGMGAAASEGARDAPKLPRNCADSRGMRTLFSSCFIPRSPCCTAVRQPRKSSRMLRLPDDAILGESESAPSCRSLWASLATRIGGRRALYALANKWPAITCNLPCTRVHTRTCTPILLFPASAVPHRLSFSCLPFRRCASAPGAIHRLPGNCQRSAPRNAGVAGQGGPAGAT